MLVAQVKTILPNAKTLVSITQPFGEYHAKQGVGVPPMLYAEMVAQAGVNFEAFGLEIEMGVPKPGNFTRDLFQLSCLLDKFSTLGRPVYITAVCRPGRNTTDSGDESNGKLDPSQGGRWHKPWDQQLQAEWIEAFYKLAFSKPYVESVAWGNLADLSHTIPGGGLLDDMLKPKPAYAKIQELREKFHQWHGRRAKPLDAVASADAARSCSFLFVFVLDPKVRAQSSSYIPDPHPPQSSRSDRARQTSSTPTPPPQAELIVLPQLGEKRVLAILEFRERQLRS